MEVTKSLREHEKTSIEDEQTLSELSSAHRRSQAKCVFRPLCVRSVLITKVKILP